MCFTFILEKNFLRTFFSINVTQSCKIRYYNKDYLKNVSLPFSLSSFHSILYAPWDSLCENTSLTHCFRCWFLLFLIFLNEKEKKGKGREPGFKEESLVSVKKNISSMYVPRLNGIKVPVLFPKNIEKKQLCRHDKVYYYFWKSNIPVINLLVDSRNMIKVSKNVGL